MATLITTLLFAAAGSQAQAQNPYPGGSYFQRGNDGALNGTWRLEPSRSDNVDQAIDRAVRGLPADERQRLDRVLTRRLTAPETIAIEQQGRHFTIASNRGRQISFDATGRARNENSLGGRPVRVNATYNRDQLIISSTGDRGHDYNVTFDTTEGGRKLRVIRRIFSDRLRQPVTVVSLYDKTSDVAQLDQYRGSYYSRNGNDRSGSGRNSFLISNGTPVVAVLNRDLDTKTLREGDPISLVVRAPREYDGAVLEGTVTNVERSGKVSGRAGMTFDFDRISLRNGESYRFAGYVESIRTAGGEEVKIDNEGSIRDEDSQTQRTVTRTGIGAALGAVIGAIAGGGKGAAIGAAVGGGAGAGSVFVQGRDDLELRNGAEFTIRAVTPRDAEARR
ncbi:MAG TPA: YMGG-like glycine zipper-containing protein [Blastocatellia bacterium]|nr:YMGG-like glycine zipper-containing protein [Blastocatellia bacterium]